MIELTETFPDGRQHKIKLSSCFNEEEFAAGYLRAREDINTLGLDAALQKWHDEEAVERRKLGLKVKKRY